MIRAPRYTKAIDLPPDMQSINSLNAYEIGRDHVRIACQLSDPSNNIGELALLKVSMTTMSVEVEKVFDGISVAFFSRRDSRDVLISTGGIVWLLGALGWEMFLVKAKFLLDAFSLDARTNFVLGDGGEIFRFDEGHLWTRDAVESKERLFGMHGASRERLFAVGCNGTVLKEKSGAWEIIDLAVGTDIRCVFVEDDRVILGGDGGLAGILGDGEYISIDTGIKSDILAICPYRGDIYFADSDFGVHRLSGGAFQQVANLGYTYRINGGDRLTAVCGEYIFQFDGAAWRGIELSYRGGYQADPFDMSFLG